MTAVVTSPLLPSQGLAEGSQRGPFSGVVSELQRLNPATPLATQPRHSSMTRSFAHLDIPARSGQRVHKDRQSPSGLPRGSESEWGPSRSHR
jgi:hypothetical protein